MKYIRIYEVKSSINETFLSTTRRGLVFIDKTSEINTRPPTNKAHITWNFYPGLIIKNIIIILCIRKLLISREKYNFHWECPEGWQLSSFRELTCSCRRLQELIYKPFQEHQKSCKINRWTQYLHISFHTIVINLNKCYPATFHNLIMKYSDGS